MADVIDVKGVIKHLVDGTLERNLCRICLLPLGEIFENIFTKVCKEGQEYCTADVLEAVCQIKVSSEDNYYVCCDCFLMASSAYRFYILSKRSEEILNFYVEQLEENVYYVEQLDEFSHDSLCITLPEYQPSVENFDYDIEPCLINNYVMDNEVYENEEIKQEIIIQSKELKDNVTDSRKRKAKDIKYEPCENKEIKIEREAKDNIQESRKRTSKDLKGEDLVVVINETGQRTFYNITDDGTLEMVPKKSRKKRDPMEYIKCSQCPVKYRFLSKLKTHMKLEHGIDLYICKVCKTITEDAKEFELHLLNHKDIHCCNYCNTVFKKRDTIIAHLKWHEEMKNLSDTDSTHVCEICGYILPDEEQLKDHYDKKHDKKFTCFYCGKMYKGELSCESHIRKHEMVKNLKEKGSEKNASIKEKAQEGKPEPKTGSLGKKRTICDTCGKDFVDERSLLWHSMLHTNERPYTCDTCGRGFISSNRRNQHALCAHTQPARRCPLCPALFHLRSMVNSHIKKVHLAAHKRRNRSNKHSLKSVSWRTEQVPLQELSVSIQSDILELQTGGSDTPPFEWTAKDMP